MRVVTDLPYKVLPIELAPKSKAAATTLIIKGTFALAHGGPVAPLPADKQRDINGDTPFMDDLGRSLNAASDLVPSKVCGEVTVIAEAYAPGGKPVTQLDVGIAVGRVSKALQVFGDRAWVPDSLGTLRIQGPLAFTSLPIRWERAFGGLASRANPMGRGLDLWPEADGRKIFFLANIEAKGTHVASRDDRPEPVGFAPLLPHWEPRRKRAGTQDARWATFRAPLPPLDFDPRYYNAAPQDQWIDGFWHGDEPITLYNLSAEHPTLIGALPGRRVRAFVHRKRLDESGKPGEGEEFSELRIRLDTVHIDAIEKVVVLTWRGSYQPQTPKASELIAFYAAEEPVAAQPAPLQSHLDQYLRATEPPPAKAPKADAPAEPPPSPDFGPALAEAMKALSDAKVDPAILAKLAAAPSPEAKLDMTMDLMKSLVNDMDRAVSGMRNPSA